VQYLGSSSEGGKSGLAYHLNIGALRRVHLVGQRIKWLTMAGKKTEHSSTAQLIKDGEHWSKKG